MKKIIACGSSASKSKASKSNQGVPTHGHNMRNPTCIHYNWYAEHESNPYPTREEKQELALDSGLTLQQVSFWFYRQRSKSGKTQKQSVTGPLEVVYPKLLDEKNLKPTRLQVDKLKLVANQVDTVWLLGTPKDQSEEEGERS